MTATDLANVRIAFALAEILVLVMSRVFYVIVVTHAFCNDLIRLGVPRCNYVLVWWRHCLTMVLYLAFEVFWTHSRVNEVMVITEQFTIILVSFLLYCFRSHWYTIYAYTICLLSHGMLLLFYRFCQLFMLYAQIFGRLDLLVLRHYRCYL